MFRFMKIYLLVLFQNTLENKALHTLVSKKMSKKFSDHGQCYYFLRILLHSEVSNLLLKISKVLINCPQTLSLLYFQAISSLEVDMISNL